LFPNRLVALLGEIGANTPDDDSPNGNKVKRLGYIFAVAMAGSLSYLLVLGALRFTPVSYVTPVRASSVVITTWIGVRYLNEAGGMRRMIASLLVAGGIALIAFGG
jgi:drug/metabolite transporter (DMT)-like permease